MNKNDNFVSRRCLYYISPDTIANSKSQKSISLSLLEPIFARYQSAAMSEANRERG